MSRLILLSILFALMGCSHTDSQIVPLGETLNSSDVASTHNIKSITLPTPQIQNAPNGYYQDDAELRVAIAAINTRAIPSANQDERGACYLVLTLTLTNFADKPKDVTSFPFGVWVRDKSSNQEYAPEIYAPSEKNLWQAIDQLNKGTVKMLGKHQTVRGELFFQVPKSAVEFELIWQPNAQRQWILSIPKLR